MEVFTSMRFGQTPPWELLRDRFCERYGWTFQQFDETSLEDINLTLAVWDGIAKSEGRGSNG